METFWTVPVSRHKLPRRTQGRSVLVSPWGGGVQLWVGGCLRGTGGWWARAKGWDRGCASERPQAPGSSLPVS